MALRASDAIGQPGPEPLEERANPARVLFGYARAIDLEQPAQRFVEILSNAQDAKPIAVGEHEVRIAGAELVPELPHAELVIPHVDVVEQNHAPRTHRPEPSLEVVLGGLVGVETVDVEQVDAAGLEATGRLIERGTHQLGKLPIAGVVIPGEFVEYLLPVEAGMRIAAPRIDGKASCIESGALDRLGEGRIGIAVVGAELDQQLRPMDIDEPERKRDVPDPGGWSDEPVRIIEDDRSPEDVRLNATGHSAPGGSGFGRSLVKNGLQDNLSVRSAPAPGSGTPLPRRVDGFRYLSSIGRPSLTDREPSCSLVLL